MEREGKWRHQRERDEPYVCVTRWFSIRDSSGGRFEDELKNIEKLRKKKIVFGDHDVIKTNDSLDRGRTRRRWRWWMGERGGGGEEDRTKIKTKQTLF